MAGYSLNTPLPVVAGLDPARDTWAFDGKVNFETAKGAREEDVERQKSLLTAINDHPASINVDHARELECRLERNPKDPTPALTLASSVDYRPIRRGLTSQVWRLMTASGMENAAAVTLRPNDLLIPAAELTVDRLRGITRHFKTEFARAGISGARGLLQAGLHAEFDIRRKAYDVHLHMSVAGEKTEAVEALRSLDRYAWTKGALLPDGRKQSARVIVSRLKPEHYPNRLTYACQSYWPHSPTGNFGGSDDMKRSHRAGRIPEPYHAQWLLLMDSLKVSDLIFTSGLKLSSNGLRLA